MQNNFAKGYTSNWSEEVFMAEKVKNFVPWTYVICDLKGEKIMKKSCKRHVRQNAGLRMLKGKKSTILLSNGRAMITHLID